MKNLKKVLALVLAVVMIMGTVAVASAKDYADIKADSDYAEAIDVLSNLNILDGFKNGETYNFQPDGYFTRAQAAKIVAIVHNAATNGKIKGQDAISSLYSNAQNPFVDCNNSWALPFINYCRITGLADGMTKTTYAPERRLTGVQWLKLMLTTLNFDTAKEGYTGTGWDINVLNRANELGLLAGLPTGWKAIENIKRGEGCSDPLQRADHEPCRVWPEHQGLQSHGCGWQLPHQGVRRQRVRCVHRCSARRQDGRRHHPYH